MSSPAHPLWPVSHAIGAPRRWRPGPWTTAASLLLLVGAGAAWAWRFSTAPPAFVVVESVGVPLYQATLILEVDSLVPVNAAVAGRVALAPFRTGDSVRAGDVLVQFENDALKRELSEAALAASQAAADTLQQRLSGDQRRVDAAQAALTAYSGALPFRLLQMERSRQAPPTDLAPEVTRAAALADTIVAWRERLIRREAEMDSVRSRLSAETAGRKQQVLANVQGQVARLTVRAPVSGRWSANDSVLRRGAVNPGDRVGTVVARGTPRGTISISGRLLDPDRTALEEAVSEGMAGQTLSFTDWRRDPAVVDARERFEVRVATPNALRTGVGQPLPVTLRLPERPARWVRRQPEWAPFSQRRILFPDGAERSVQFGPALRVGDAGSVVEAIEVLAPVERPATSGPERRR